MENVQDARISRKYKVTTGTDMFVSVECVMWASEKGIHTSQNENGYLYINLYLHTDVPSMPWGNRKGEISAWRCPLVSIHFDVYSLGDISTLTNIWKIETSTVTQSGEVKNKFLPDIFCEMKGNTIIIAEIVRLEWT